MNLFSNKSTKKYFLTKKSNINTDANVDLILSPEFYWVRIFEIPVDNEKKAIKVLSTLFEDILPNDQFDYAISKIDKNRYFCFAFNNNDILEYIKKSGLSFSQVNSVYFAQTQMVDYKSFIIDDSTFIYDNEILLKVPKIFSPDAKELSGELNFVPSGKHKINIRFYSNTINSKYVYTLVFLLSIISLINVYKYVSYSNVITHMQTHVNKIKKTNNIPATNIQTQSILLNMEKKVEKSINFREALSYILKFNDSKNNSTLESISYKNKKIKLVFSNTQHKKIIRYLKKKFKILSNNTSGNFVNVEVQL